MFRGDNYSGRALTKYYGYRPEYSGNAAAKAVIEIEFTTSNDRVQWAIENRVALASAFIAAVYEYFNMTPPVWVDQEEPMTPEEKARFDELEIAVRQATRKNNGQQERIVNLRNKLREAEAEIVELRDGLARVERRMDNGGA